MQSLIGILEAERDRILLPRSSKLRWDVLIASMVRAVAAAPGPTTTCGGLGCEDHYTRSMRHDAGQPCNRRE